MEITPIIGCRVQCSFCPQSLLMTRYQNENNLENITFGKPVLMSFETFKMCIDKIPKKVDIHFSGFSEAWLNPECTKMLLYAYEKGHQVAGFSTLVGMTVDDVENFKHIPFKMFLIHLPDNQLYAKISVNKQYVEVLKKIISSNIRNLKLMSMSDLPPKIKQVIGTDFTASYMHDRAGNNELGEKTPRKYGPLFCSRANKYGKNILDDNVLLPNGDVCLCCQDYGMDYIIGNLINGDYPSLFRSKEFQSIIKKMNAEDSDIMCRVCNFSSQTTKTNILKELIHKKIAESHKKWTIKSLFAKNIPRKN